MKNQRRVTVTLLLGLLAAVLLTPFLTNQASQALAQPAVDYTLTNDGGLRFLGEYQRLGGVATLGYPASHRFQLPDGLTYQATQGALLQWRPELNAAVLANAFEMLESVGKDDWLYAFKGIPRPIQDDRSGGDWQKAKETRLGWLTDEKIKARYLANPNPGAIANWTLDDSIQLYGLPMSRPERFGPFICQRFQRVSLQLWTEAVAGMPAPGTVVRVLGGDLLKDAGLIPSDALEPEDRPTPTATATRTPVPPTPTATRAPSRPAATATPTAMATPTIVPMPTPDPMHPPEQGTFTGYYDFDRGPAVGYCMDVCAPRLSGVVPFHNLAFSDSWVGKTLVVTRLSYSCPEGVDRCEGPEVWLYRSYIGELKNRMHITIPQPLGEPRRSDYDAILVTVQSPSSESFQWPVEYGQYFVLWLYASSGIHVTNGAASVTYSLEVR